MAGKSHHSVAPPDKHRVLFSDRIHSIIYAEISVAGGLGSVVAGNAVADR